MVQLLRCGVAVKTAEPFLLHDHNFLPPNNSRLTGFHFLSASIPVDAYFVTLANYFGGVLKHRIPTASNRGGRAKDTIQKSKIAKMGFFDGNVITKMS